MKALLKITVLTILLLGISFVSFAQKGETLFQQGMMKEEGEGNLKEAIDIYNKLVADNTIDRKIRAKALFQVGICYEKLGQKKATTAYEQLISQFGDQKELISIARKKLKFLKKGAVESNSKGLLSQRIKKQIPSSVLLHRVSPDGKYYSFLETTPGSEDDNKIIVYNIQTGKRTAVSEYTWMGPDKRSSMAWNSVWSPDGKKIAYYFNKYKHEGIAKGEIHIVNADGSNREVVYSEIVNGWGEVYDYSYDGKQVLFIAEESNQGKSTVKLMQVNIDSKRAELIKEFDSKVHSFRYSPKGAFIVFTKADDIFTLNIKNGQETQVTFFDGMDWSPEWSTSGDKLLFISDRQGSNDLFSIPVAEGKPSGSPIPLKRQLGEGADIMSVDNTGAIYFFTNNSRTNLYTVDFSEEMDILPNSKKQITAPNSGNSSGLARFSKDGKYISYQGNLTKMSDGLRSDINSKYANFDEELGYLYKIYIYNTQTENTKLLDIPLYLNHYPRSQSWMVPTWSYQGNQLLIHGRIRDNYTGGFFVVDVEKETLAPALTKPNCKNGMKWDEVEMGNSMYFSRKKDIIYYSTPGFEKAIQYNINTGEKKTIADFGRFWFGGFTDEAETKLNGSSEELGHFEFDINTGKLEKYAERGFNKPNPLFFGKTEGFVMYDMRGMVIFSDVENKNGQNNRVLRLEFDSGEIKDFNLNDLFPNCRIRIADYRSADRRLLLGVTQNPGNEIYKISNVFK